MEPFSDEDFRLFANALSDVFDVNHINDLQLWSWQNKGHVMRADRYAPVPESCYQFHPAKHGTALMFAVYARKHDGVVRYDLVFANFQCVDFDSLESLIDVVTDIFKSLKLSSKSLGEVV